jgi:ABC-2 type transport system permease protein
MNTKVGKVIDYLNIVWTISAKDIRDALKNRVIIGQIIAVTFILLTVKGLSWAIQPPYTQIVVFDHGDSQLLLSLEDSPDIDVQNANSLEELQQIIGNMGYGLGPELGLEIPQNFDQSLESRNNPQVNGYVSWANRTKAESLIFEMEESLFLLTGQQVRVDINGHIISPPVEIGLFGGLITMFAVTIILFMGIILVPSLMLEEKRTRTIEALLLSPVSISQVMVGKAVAGFFYILITAAIVYTIYWTGVVNWGLTVIFVAGAGLFSVGIGLLFGIIFESEQEMTGWMSLVLIIITASILVVLLGLEMPLFLETAVNWLPPVALAKIFWASFSTQAKSAQIWLNLGIITITSGIIYGVIIWRLRGTDR